MPDSGRHSVQASMSDYIKAIVSWVQLGFPFCKSDNLKQGPFPSQQDDRFTKLAQLRSMALEPLTAAPEVYANATVIFINDIAICAEDILELVHQRFAQGADMTCAFDWICGSDGATLL